MHELIGGKMKFLILLGLILSTSVSFAAIKPGAYTGASNYTTGSESNKKTYSKKREITIHVQLASAATDLAYGLIVDGGRASLYRIEELPDGNQLWLQLFQGQNGVLKVDDNAEPDFTATTFTDGKRTRLVLKPTAQRIRCGESTLDVSLTNQSAWKALPQQPMAFKSKDGSLSAYNVTNFKGTLNLNGQSFTGVLILNEVLPRVATLRRTIIDQKSISGYRQDRNIYGFVTNIGARANNLLFLGLPAGVRQCSYETQYLGQE